VAGSRHLSWHSLSIGDAREGSLGVPSSPYGKTHRIRSWASDVHSTDAFGLLGSVLGLGPWRSVEDVEFATLERVWWFNHHHLLEPIGYVPLVEHEEACYRQQETYVGEEWPM
jgi:hypothetical protein